MVLACTSFIQEQIRDAATRAGRRPQDVRLVAVTKTVGLATIREAINAGLRIFGENRVQEGRDKIEALAGEEVPPLSWHLIGHLQSNKAKYAVRLFDLIHSVDSRELAHDLDIEAAKHGRVQRVLVQVKLSEEETKHGAEPDTVRTLVEYVSGFKHLRLEGLMTIPPFFDEPEAVRPYFRELRKLRNHLKGLGFQLPELSMGMSNDFEVAIEEGATLVRVGTALFGERS